MGSLQLLLSFCGQRDRSILQELQLETLGKVSEAVEPEAKSLTSLKAVVMPRNEVSNNICFIKIILKEKFGCVGHYMYIICIT